MTHRIVSVAGLVVLSACPAIGQGPPHYAGTVVGPYKALMRMGNPVRRDYPWYRVLVYADGPKLCVTNECIFAPTRKGPAAPKLDPYAAIELRVLKGRPFFLVHRVYDGKAPEVVWSYRPSLQGFGFPRPADRDRIVQMAWRQAGGGPEISSIYHLLQLVAHRDGVDAVMKRYGIPDVHRREISEPPRTEPKPVSPLQTKDQMLEVLARFGYRTAPSVVGAGVVAGHRCKILEVRSSRGAVAGSSPMILTRLWVEDRSGLVMKRESRLTGAIVSSRMPPDFEVKELTFVKRLPPSVFELPPGTHVAVTALMNDAGVKLPAGVIRVPNLKWHGLPSCGIDFSHEYTVSTLSGRRGRL